MSDVPSKPNILFIMTDQQRWDAMSCSGGWVNTPNMDRIAGEGVRFTNCLTNSPVCIPARLSLMTGLYPHNTGVWNNLELDVPADAPSWMRAVRDAGYRTSLFGKTHLHHHSGDLRDREHLLHGYGLDDVDEVGGPRASQHLMSHMTALWEERGLLQAYRDDYAERFSNDPTVVRPSALPLELYADTYVGQRAREYLGAYDRPEPWFCWVSFGGPHEPWDTPEPYASLYAPDDMPEPAPRPEWARQLGQTTLDKRLGRGRGVSKAHASRLRADYAGKVTLIDDQIGEILAVIERRGELDNTVIAFTSDHGEMNGDYGLVYKSNPLNGAVRIPMLLRTPATAADPRLCGVRHEPCELMDLGPTLVEHAGGRIAHRHFAKSLNSLLTEPGARHRPYALCELDGEITIMDQHWKMVVDHHGEPYLLFDQETDPLEQFNRVDDPECATVVAAMKEGVYRRLTGAQILRPLFGAVEQAS